MNIEASPILNFAFFYKYEITFEILIVKIVTLISLRIPPSPKKKSKYEIS